MDQDSVEYTDGNYINMQIEELPYDQKDEGAYLKFPGDEDNDLENTFLPVLISSPKKNIKQSKKNKRTKKHKKPKGRSKTKVDAKTKVDTKTKVKSWYKDESRQRRK